MPKETNILWTDSTWNPFSGCVKVSPGCDHCYAETFAERMRGSTSFPNGFDLTIREHKFNDPFKWKEPRRIFVNSMSDLFLGTVPVETLVKVWRVMLEADWHTYQILTKRPIPARRLIHELNLELPPHIWLGVSVEDQQRADERIPVLMNIPVPVRFLSCEPLLSNLSIDRYLAGGGIHWVITGGESGRERRPADQDWFRSLRDQCREAGVALFHKQGNADNPGLDRLLDGRTWDEYPEILLA